MEWLHSVNAKTPQEPLLRYTARKLSPAGVRMLNQQRSVGGPAFQTNQNAVPATNMAARSATTVNELDHRTLNVASGHFQLDSASASHYADSSRSVMANKTHRHIFPLYPLSSIFRLPTQA
jgi:hypothetical protein